MSRSAGIVMRPFFTEESDEAERSARGHRNGQATFLLSGDAGDRQRFKT